jgi:hypothetical protein
MEESLRSTRSQLIDSAQDFSDFIGGYLPGAAKPFQNRISKPISELVGGLAGVTGFADKALGVVNWAANATVATVAPNSELARQAGEETNELIESATETYQALKAMASRGAQMVREDPLGAAGTAMEMAESGLNKALNHAVALARDDPRATASTTAFATEFAADIVIGSKGASAARGALRTAGRQVDDLAGSFFGRVARRTAPPGLTPSRGPIAYGTPYRQLHSRQVARLQARIADRTVTKAEWKRLQWHERLQARRQRGVDAFWAAERQRLRVGQSGTRNWSPEAVEEILSGPRGPRNIQSHHKYSVSQYPQLADDPLNIEPVTYFEHRFRWHGGSWSRPTHGVPLDPSIPDWF